MLMEIKAKETEEDREEERFHNQMHLDDIKRHASNFPIFGDALLLAREIGRGDEGTYWGGGDFGCKYCLTLITRWENGARKNYPHAPDCPYIQATSIMERLRELSK